VFQERRRSVKMASVDPSILSIHSLQALKLWLHVAWCYSCSDRCKLPAWSGQSRGC